MASHRIDPNRPGHDWSSISYAVAILSPDLFFRSLPGMFHFRPAA